MNLFYRLGEEVPDKASVGEPVPIRQGSGELRSAQDVSSEHLASRGKEEGKADVFNLSLAGALQAQALGQELQVIFFGYHQLSVLAHCNHPR